MAISIRLIAYYNAKVQDRPGEGYQLLHHLAQEGVDLVAFTGVPVGDHSTQVALFPEEASKLESVARLANLELDGPHSAILVQGDDSLGTLAELHQKLSNVGVNIYASNGVTDGKGNFGCVLYVAEGQHQKALQALGA
jgi:hypothetical protein